MADLSPEEPKIIKITEGIFVRQEIDNITWIDVGDYLVVVDTLEKTQAEQDVFSAISQTVGDKPVRFVLNTHTHYDHVALNDAFVKRYGSEIISQPKSKIPPEGRWFDGGGRRVGMIPMPGCHTIEDCIVHVLDDTGEGKSVLLTGDIFGWGLVPLTRGLTDKTARILLDTYQKLADLNSDVVIPGHGPIISNSHLERWIKYFKNVCAEARDMLDKGMDKTQICQSIKPPADMSDWWRFLAWKHADTVSKVVRAISRGRLHL